MAERLITGLAGEFERWTKSIGEMSIKEGECWAPALAAFGTAEAVRQE